MIGKDVCVNMINATVQFQAKNNFTQQHVTHQLIFPLLQGVANLCICSTPITALFRHFQVWCLERFEIHLLIGENKDYPVS